MLSQNIFGSKVRFCGVFTPYLSVFCPNAGKCGPDNSEYGYFFIHFVRWRFFQKQLTPERVLNTSRKCSNHNEINCGMLIDINLIQKKKKKKSLIHMS